MRQKVERGRRLWGYCDERRQAREVSCRRVRLIFSCSLWVVQLTISVHSSKSGLVNVYDDDAFGSSFIGTPTVKKTLQNLTTSISTLCFNHDSQLAAMASNAKKDQMRLVSALLPHYYRYDAQRSAKVHLPSLTAYSNWPTSSTPLGHVTSVDFSPTGEYIAIGNNRGRALLYQLSHYASLR